MAICYGYSENLYPRVFTIRSELMELISLGAEGPSVRRAVYLLTDAAQCASLLSALRGSDSPGAPAGADSTPADLALIPVPVEDWNRDLTPWPALKVFGKGEDFSGGADRFLSELRESIDSFEREKHMTPVERILGGYSLGGLFAVYGAVRSDLFTGFLSVSGSMWYDGFGDWLEGTAFPKGLTRAYFSVGDREKNSKNERMKRVETETGRIAGLFEARGVTSVFEMNPGTHFTDPEGRILRGIQWIFR